MIPLVRKLAITLGAVDQPGKRKVHLAPIPRLGGVGIYIGFFLSLFLIIWAYHAYELGYFFRPLITGATILLLVGIIDDTYGMQPPIKLFLQCLAAIVTYSLGVRVEFFSSPWGGIFQVPAFISMLITVLWIVGLANTINLVDGIDGLAAGITLIAAFTLFIVAVILKRYEVAVLAFTLCGTTLGFLRYNFSPASIFMGDTGSMLLGYFLACISVLGVLKSSATLALAVPLLALGVPLLDTVAAIVRRVKQNRHIFWADDKHLHHRLLALGFSQRQAVFLIYYISVLLSMGAIMIVSVTGFAALISLLVLFALIYIGFKVIQKMELV